MFGQITFYIFAVVTVGLSVFLGIKLRQLIKDNREVVDFKSYFKLFGILSVSITGAFTIAMAGAYGFIKQSPKVYEVILGILGALLFSGSVTTFFVTFISHYYRTDLPENLNKWLYRIMLIMIPTMICTFFVMTDGYAEYWKYPLINGLNFKEGLVTPLDKKAGVTPNIAWYALCILSGALFVYFLADHKMYKQYGKHGLLESTFFVAFPAGIIGARLFYVIGEWQDFADNPITALYMWDGGLTILGGAITGIVVGVLWFMWRNKGYNIWVAIDLIVPTILLAQAIGRWGNFFNCEVHGLEVSADYFKWLPTVLLRNAAYSEGIGYAHPGMIFLPLYMIEGVINIAGYFILSELFGRALKQYKEYGDLCFGYVAWYGLTRLTLEPLRHPHYNMAEDGYWSWLWSIVFVICGILAIVLNHIIRYIIRCKKNTNYVEKNYMLREPIVIAVLALLAIGFGIGAGIMMASGKPSDKLVYNIYNGGLILLTVSISALLMTINPIIKLFEARRINKLATNEK